MYSRLCEKWAVCTPAVVTEPRYRSRHVSGVCCHDKSGMPESRALLLCAFIPGSAGVSWYISSDLATPVFFGPLHARVLFIMTIIIIRPIVVS